jgi:hypothetical protein
MNARIAIDRADSDVSLFYTLLFYGEMLSKTVAAGMVACIGEDLDRNQYRLLHRLVRSDGIGGWAMVLDDLLNGPASVHLRESARAEQRQLTQKVGPGEWQYECVAALSECARAMGVEIEERPGRVAAQVWFTDFATLRNKTRGHAAPQGRQCAESCGSLERSLSLLVENVALFKRPWAHLHQNLSRKYRITQLGGDSSPFDHLKRETNHNYRAGVYLALENELCPVELIFSDADASDFLYANGQFKDGEFEVLSYISNARLRVSGEQYLAPSERLPQSHTQGRGSLDKMGSCFANLPPQAKGYITRTSLEGALREQLLLTERHPIVTMTGSGGTGKTSMALKVLYDLTLLPSLPFEVILWFSARDIDLLPEGAKPVRPHTLSIRDFSKEFVRLVEPPERSDKSFKAEDYFAQALGNSPVGHALFVFDNFETVVSPPDMFRWIDTYVRLPNKVLITTRMREFASDYPIEVSGMNEDEAASLVDSVVGGLGIADLMTPAYRDDVYQESDGHPYVIKILLGEVARLRKAVKPERIVASQDQILAALFERTYALLSTAAQRVFLVLCSWRSVVPQIALEAILLRPENERINVAAAVDELKRMSLVEELVSGEDSQIFLNVPLAAIVFGRRKLTASPLKPAVEADVAILRTLGAARKEDVRHGVLPRVRRLLQTMAGEVSRGTATLDDRRPVLEFIASKIPVVWLDMAQLYGEVGGTGALEKSRECLRRYLEAPDPGQSTILVWRDLAEVSRKLDDSAGEVHALVEMCQVAGVTADQISNAANRINNIYGELKQRGVNLDSQERQVLVKKIANVMQQRMKDWDAVDCSRLSWLFMHLRDYKSAREAADQGIKLDPNNEHCLRLLERLA